MAFTKTMRAETLKPIDDENEKQEAMKKAAANRASGSVPQK